MGVEVIGDGSLGFSAGIDLKDFDKGIIGIENGLKNIVATAVQTADATKKEFAEIGKLKDDITKPGAVNVGGIIGAEVFDNLKKIFGSIDAPTQKFIQDLIDLELQLQSLQVTQNELVESFNAGKISEQEYADQSALLIGGIAEINKQTIALTESQNAYEDSLKNSAGSIDEKEASLIKLKSAYKGLTEAQRDSPEGKNLAKNIADLKLQIKGLDPEKLNQSKQSVKSIRSELFNLQELMARNPDSPQFDTWKKQAAELKEGLAAVKKGVEQATNSTAGVEAFASGLRGLVGGFTAAAGVAGLFTSETDKIDEVTKNAASALALLNGVQEISNVLSKNGALNVYLLGLMRKNSAIATIAETAATNINTAATGVNTVATEAQSAAAVQGAIAQRGLAAAMLANPAALVIIGITALAVAYFALRNEEKALTLQQKALAEQSKSSAEIFAKSADGAGSAAAEVSKLSTQIKLAKDGFLDKNKVVDEYNSTIGKTTGFVKDINEAEQALIKNAPAYIQLMGLKAKAAAAGALAQEELSKQINESRYEEKEFFKVVKTTGDGFADREREKFKNAVKERQEQAKKARQSNVDFYLNTQNDAVAAAAKLAAENKFNFFGDNNEDAKAKKTSDTIKGLNDLLNEQKSLLQDINNLDRDAAQSGLIKEATAIDKINEKYDLAIAKIADYNNKVAEFNKNNPTNKVATISIESLNADRAIELQNAAFKQNAENYKKSLSEQQRAFEDFEKAKNDFGLDKAKELYKGLTDDADSYLDFLKKQQTELEKIGNVEIGPGQQKNLEVQLKIKENKEAQIKEEERLRAQAVQNELNNLRTLLEATVTFNQQKLNINKKYDDLEATLNKNSSLADFEERKAILKQGRADELQELQNNIIRSSDLYRQLNQDIIGFTRDRIKEEIKILKEKLKADASLTPEIKANIQSTIDRYNGLLDETNETAKKYEKLAGSLGEISGIFGDLASSLEGLNDGLADTLSTMGEIVGIAGAAAGAIASFASGDIIGGIAKTVKVITGIFSIGKKARESERKAQEEIAAFNNRILLGEQDITQEIRNRQREQIKLNKLKLEGLNAEKKLLDQQKKAVQEQYNSIFAKLQNESFVSSETTKKYGGFLGIGRKTKVVEIAQGLAGRSFDDLEKLFAQGQLTGKAKELFEMLQKIKQEGVDIDAQLAANAEEAKQIFTGTTSDSISDSIVDGFKNGLNSASDFAGTFEDLMRNAMIQSLKFKYLEGPLKDFFDQFAAASESEGQLTSTEIDNLRSTFGGIINNANQQFDQLQQIAGLNFGSSGTAAGNSLTGAIKGITESQAELLAGQFGGLRITAIESLSVSRNQLSALNMIQINTSNNVVKMAALLTKFDAYETGLQRLHVKI